MYKSINIISRASILAKIQAEMVGEAINKTFPEISINYVNTKTSGDLDQQLDISSGNTIGVFTSDISKKVEQSSNSIAVHSWKDFPILTSGKTNIYGALKRADMRDMLVLKNNLKDHKYIKQFTVMTSSPRRRYSIENHLKELLPIDYDNINFKDIRGNIDTRLNKFLKSDAHGIVIAKAAIDRILNDSKNNLKAKTLIKKCLKMHHSIILPLSIFPSAPAQGAIGIEVANSNKDLIKIVKSINHIKTFDNVCLERKIMSAYGGGCSQKIGVSIWEKNKRKVKSINGLTEDNIKLETFEMIVSIKERTSLKPIVNISKAFPIGRNEQSIFKRLQTNKNNEISKIKNSIVYITRKTVLTHIPKFDESCILITSGVKTWKSSAKRGYWISGTSDSLGQSEITKLKTLFGEKNIIKLTFSNEFSTSKDSIDLYKLKEPKFPKDIEQREAFFWMSPYAFRTAVKMYPSILNKRHSCGMGNTYNQIKELIKDKKTLTPYLSYEDWLNTLEN